MGCVDTITYDTFPKQTEMVGKRVSVCYHYDASKKHLGTIIRDDKEKPFETIIKPDNGRYLRTAECQYSTVE